MSRTVHCIKLGQDAEGLAKPPIPGALGQRIFDNVSKQAWADWLAHQTRLINENRLSLADPRARKYLLDQAEKFFFSGGADREVAIGTGDRVGAGLVHVTVRVRGVLGVVSVLDGGLILMNSSWSPSPRVSLLLTNVGGLLKKGAISLRFTTVTGTAQIDDVYVDPWVST